MDVRSKCPIEIPSAGCFVFPVLMRISCLSGGGGGGGGRRGAKGKAEQNNHSEAHKVVSGPQDGHSPFI